MKVLVNAMSIKVGGALVLLKVLVTEMLEQRPDIDWHLVLNHGITGTLDFNSENVTISTFPHAERSPLHNSWFYLYSLPRLVKESRADVLFSLTNYLPVKSEIPTLLLVHNAGFFCKTFERLHKQKYPGVLSRLAWYAKKRRINRSVHGATVVTVQTEAMADSLCKSTALQREKIVVVPHGSGACSPGAAHTPPVGRTWRIGFLTTYGVQKNFEDLFAAAAILRGSGADIKVVVTLDSEETLANALLLHAEKAGIGSIIENHGTVPPENMQMLYDSLDIFVFPSLCESFGFPMLEAMSRGLPIIVADIPGNREVCGDGVSCYQPGDARDLAVRLEMLMANPAHYSEAATRSVSQSRLFSWHKAAEEICGIISGMVARNSG